MGINRFAFLCVGCLAEVLHPDLANARTATILPSPRTYRRTLTSLYPESVR